VEALEARLRSSREVLSWLSLTLEALNLLDLYRQYFPKEFAGLHLSWSDREAIVQAYGSFNELVDRHLFPVYSPCWEMEDEISLEWILPYAPFPVWWEMDETEISPLQRVILQATGEMGESGEITLHHSGSQRRSLDQELLQSITCKEKGPLKDLMTAVSFTLKVTNNVWCDITDEEINNASDFPEWSIPNIEWLAEEWKRALEIHGKFKDLEAWMLSKMPRREQTIHRLIDRAMTPAAAPAAGMARPLQETPAEALDREEAHVEE
jgi:hypothetical protein